MLIEKKNTTDLLPADYNPRKDLKPGDAEYEKLKRSIEQFGYVEPVIWNKTTGRVVGGHQRLKVLIDMGITEVECVVVEMDEDKEKALNIALNKISGDWDKDKLALLIADLPGADFDVSLTGFEPAEIDALYKDTLSDKCRTVWWNSHPEAVNRKAVYSFTCAHCGKPFTAYGNAGRKYCSHACYIADRYKGGDEHE